MGLTLDTLTNQTKVSYQDYLAMMIGQVPFYAGLIFLSTSWLVRRLLVGDSNSIYRVLNNRSLKLPLAESSINDANVYTEEYSNLRASEPKALKPSNGRLACYYTSRLLVIVALFCFFFAIGVAGGMNLFFLDEYLAVLVGLLLSHLVALRLLYIENPIRQMGSSFFRVQWDVVKKSFLNSKKFFVGFEVFSLLTTLFFFFLLKGSCFCFYNKPAGSLFAFEGSKAVYSTWLTRRLSLDPICSRNSGPCHLYLTLPENSTHFAFLNVHTGVDVSQISVNFTVNGGPILKGQNGTKTELSFLDNIGERNVFSFLLSDLEPRANCSILLEFSNGKTYGPFWYLVPPDELGEGEEFIMMTGGDMGTTDVAAQVTKATASHDPSVFVIGGDLMYDNNMRNCYLATDQFLDILTNTAQESSPNRLIPLILILGNHDIGLNPLSGIEVPMTPEKAPYFYTFFPQHFPREQNNTIAYRVPLLEERVPFFYHEMAGLMHISLDSGYMYDFSGVQFSFLKSALERSLQRRSLRMVAYHVPFYPSCGMSKSFRPQGTVDAYLYWLPLFDQYRVLVAYENHVHEMKRTYPVFGNGKVESGNATTYLGDGAIGVNVEECEFGVNLPELFAYVSKENHAWVTRVANQSTFIEGISGNGTVLDAVRLDHDYFYGSSFD